MYTLILLTTHCLNRVTLKKLLRVLLRIILTPSICWGNTSVETSRMTVRSLILLFHSFSRYRLFGGETDLCSSCGESGSCLGWAGGHLSSPSGADCPSEQDVRSSEKEVGRWRKASSDGPDWKTKPEHCPCGRTTSYKKRQKQRFTMMPWPIRFSSPATI